MSDNTRLSKHGLAWVLQFPITERKAFLNECLRYIATFELTEGQENWMASIVKEQDWDDNRLIVLQVNMGLVRDDYKLPLPTPAELDLLMRGRDAAACDAGRF